MRRPAARAALVVLAMVTATIGVSTAGAARPARELRLVDMPIRITETIQGYRAPSAELARTDRSLLGLTGTRPTPVLVKFDYDGLASYAGGLSDLRATSPGVTGRELNLRRPAAAAYANYVAARESQILSSIRTRITGVQIGATFQVAFGGAAMRVPANRIGDLLRIPGVVAVMKDKLAQPQTDTTPEFLGADEVWPTLGGQSTAGENVLVGVLDTGVWPEHPSYIDPGIDPLPGSFGCEFGDGTDPALGDPFTCNDKLVGAYAFTDTYMTFIGALPGEFCNNTTGECSARDADGHGTHTSSTAVGSPVDDASIFGINRGDISGMAPGAHLIMYRVCLEEGCFQSDSIAAVEQAILDGVDVVNFSISGGTNPYTDGVELAFLDAYAAGILVNASAGNEGPGDATANHGGPWTNTVGASTSPRQWLTTVHLVAGNGDTFDAGGASITPGVSSATPVVAADDVPGYDDPGCLEPLPAASATGLVVVCLGQFSRNLRAFNVDQAGGAGMLLVVPPEEGPGNLFTDNFWLPTVTINSPDPGVDLLAFVEGHTGITAQWDTGAFTPVTPDVMTSFSSRGPLGDWIKPDVTAPGIQILAGHTPEPVSLFGGPPGEFFQVIAGTSMSSPHSAGVSALVAGVHPDWTPGQIKSALMTSSVQSVLEEDGVTPADPFDMGAGSIRANLAVSPTLTFDETAANYAAGAADPFGRIHLNTPSINAPLMPGVVTTTRTALNVSGAKQRFTVSVDAPAGASITVQPSVFTVLPGRSFTFRVTINGTGLDEGQYFGRIDLMPQSGANKVTLPVAFLKTQGDVTLSHSCEDTTIAGHTSTPCQTTVTNFAAEEANYDLSVEATPRRVVRLQNISAPGVPTTNGFEASGTLSPALAPPIESITEGGLFGYLPLEDFGVPSLADFTDETLVNIGVDPFLYGDEVYDTIGITSNGYAVVGGGGAADLDFVPQTFPDPTSPNNVLAPFWTDLNPEDAPASGAIRAAFLSDGVDTWLVIDWDEIPTFGTGGADLSSFEIWIQTAETPGELITYEMGDLGLGDLGVGTTVGAENRDGTSGVQLPAIPADFTSWTINAGSPTAGGSVTITYDAFGIRAGTGTILARLETDVTPGVTTEAVVITVT